MVFMEIREDKSYEAWKYRFFINSSAIKNLISLIMGGMKVIEIPAFK